MVLLFASIDSTQNCQQKYSTPLILSISCNQPIWLSFFDLKAEISMSIIATCEECFFDYTVKDQLAGKRIKCKECGAAIRVPTSQEVEDDADYMEDLVAEEERDRARQLKKSQKKSAPRRSTKSSRKQVSQGAKTAGIAGGALTILLVAIFVITKTGLLQKITLSQTRWVPYTTPDGNLTVSVSGKLKEKKLPVAPGIVRQRMDISENQLFGCVITSVELDVSLHNPVTKRPFSPTEIKLYLLPDFIRQTPGMRVLETSHTTFSGVAALLVKTESPFPGGTRTADMGMICVDKYLYSFTFVTPSDKPQEDLKKIFFDSVKLSDSFVQKYIELNGGVAPVVLAKKETKPNKQIASKSNTSKNAPQKVSWTVKPDPLVRRPEWTMAKKIAINLHDLSDAVYLPDPYGPTVISGVKTSSLKEISLFSLETGERTNLFKRGPSGVSKFCFSPNARLIGAYRIKTGKIDIWDLKTGDKKQTLIVDESKNNLHQMLFTDSNHFLIMQWQKSDIKMSTYSLYDLSQKSENLKPSRTFVDKTMYYNDDFIRSPGHRYIAGESHDRKDVYLLDWKNGKFVGEIDVPDSSGRGNAYYVKGIGFSPDGQWISVLSEAIHQTSLFGFSTSSGKLEWEHHWNYALSELIPEANDDSVTQAGYAINWLADSTAYSLMGRILIDVKTGKKLWYMESYPGKDYNTLHNNRSFYLTNQGMLSIESDESERQLHLKKFSPENFQKSLALLNQPDQVKIAPGSTVMLKIKIDKVEHVKKEQALEEVTALLTEKLEYEGFEVAEDADYVLNFDYRELPGEQWTSRNGQGTFPSINIQYRIQWLPKGKKKALWEVENQFIPFSVYFREEKITVNIIRDKIFEQFREHLLGRPMVYLIPKDETLPMLPQFDKTHY